MASVGVIAIQGDFSRHLRALAAIGVSAREVRTVEELAEVDRAIIPGGESTTVALLLRRYGLGEALTDAVLGGMPIWGTCMGMIMLAREIEGRPDQWSLGLLDIAVRRNAFGAQVNSFEHPVAVAGVAEDLMGVFIRAPIVIEIGTGVEVIARHRDQIVAVRQGNRIGTAFHPELTEDTRMHTYFASLS